MAWSAEQRNNAAVIYKVGLSLGASLRDIQVAISAAIVESGLRNLNYGDRDSVGMFQQRDAWGSTSARLDPYSSARMFFLGGAGGQEGLLDISNRNSRSIGSLAQDVQVSAYPDRYGMVADDAGSLLRGIDPAAGSIPVSSSGERTLGSVAQMEGLTHDPDPEDFTMSDLTEVNGAGEITADGAGIGALQFGSGMIQAPSSPVDAMTFDQGPLMFAGANDPMADLHMGQGGGTSGGGGTAGNSYHYYADGTGGGTPAPSGGTGGTSSGGFEPSGEGYAPDRSGSSANYGLGAVTPQLAYNVDALGPKFGVETVGGYRESAVDPHGHPAGLAADYMTNTDQGNALAAYAKEHADELGVDYIIWEQHIWSKDRAAEGWRPMEDRGSYTANHMDHVHINVRPDFEVPGTPYKEKPPKIEVRGDQEIAGAAKRLVGAPFKWGGDDYTGMDAVGLVRNVYKMVGKDVPKDQFDLVHRSTAITPKELEPGDIMVWDMHPLLGQTHFGIYIGNGNYVEARGPGSVVQISNLNNLPDTLNVGAGNSSVFAIKPPPRNADSYTENRYPSWTDRYSSNNSDDGETTQAASTWYPYTPPSGGSSSGGGKKPSKGPKSSGYENKDPHNLPAP